MKVIKAIQEYEKPFVFSSTKKSTLTIFVSDCTVCSENRIDILNAKSIGKENLHVFITERFIKMTVSFWDSVKKLNLKTFSNVSKQLLWRLP